MSILAQQYPVFQTAMRIVTNITNAQQAVVTTSFAHQYSTGIVVRLVVPQGYGMTQINGLFGAITVIDDVTFSIAINTLYFSPFVTPATAPDNLQYCQAIPFAEVNSTVYFAYQNVLPY